MHAGAHSAAVHEVGAEVAVGVAQGTAQVSQLNGIVHAVQTLPSPVLTTLEVAADVVPFVAAAEAANSLRLAHKHRKEWVGAENPKDKRHARRDTFVQSTAAVGHGLGTVLFPMSPLTNVVVAAYEHRQKKALRQEHEKPATLEEDMAANRRILARLNAEDSTKVR